MIIPLVFIILSLFPLSSRWSTGHYLLLTIQQKDTVAYALHGENITTSWIMDDYILKDSIRIKKASVFAEYHSEGLDTKGWKDSDFAPEYAYQYCVNLKKLKKNFIILEDNKMEINGDCTDDMSFYYEVYGDMDEEY